LQRTFSGSVEPDWIATVVLEAKPWPWSIGTSGSADCHKRLWDLVGLAAVLASLGHESQVECATALRLPTRTIT
jgi:hypothetical protein